MTKIKSIVKVADSEKNLLKFKKSYFAYLSTFFLHIDGNIKSDEFIRILNEKNINACWEKPFSEQFEIAEDFLLPSEICKKRFRVKLDDFKISLKNPKKNGFMKTPLELEVILTVYKELNVGILMLNVKLDKYTTDDLIIIRQCFDGRLKFKAQLNQSFQHEKLEYFTIKEIINSYIKTINNVFNSEIKPEKILYTNVLEIDYSTNNKKIPPVNLVKKFPRQFYGLLTGDEGWRFVPKNRAEEILSRNWTTRDFLLVLSFHYCVLSLNFKESKSYKNYLETCKNLRNQYGEKVEKYFTFSPDFAGLNHGPLLILENASVERYLLNEILEPEANIKDAKISSFLNERDQIIETLNKLSYIEIKEIREMSNMIKEKMMIKNDTIEAKNKLELFEGEILIDYNKRINALIVILTILGLIIAVISIINL